MKTEEALADVHRHFCVPEQHDPAHLALLDVASAYTSLRVGIWALGESLYGEEGWEHNQGCEGEPDCVACIGLTLRSLLDDTSHHPRNDETTETDQTEEQAHG